MQCQRIVGVIILCLCLSGCQLASDITHNLYFETCLCVTDVMAKVYYPFLAHSAWHTYLADHPDCAGSCDFACGFKAGYADYLEYGGDGHSPKLPPLRYWKLRRETPQGREATKQWLAGFRAGGAAAHASGYRQLIIVPVDKGGPEAPPVPPMAGLPPAGPPPAGPPLPPAPTADDLPNPRVVPVPAGHSRSLFAPLAPSSAKRSPAPQQPEEASADELPDPQSVEASEPEPTPQSRSLTAPLAPRPTANRVRRSEPQEASEPKAAEQALPAENPTPEPPSPLPSIPTAPQAPRQQRQLPAELPPPAEVQPTALLVEEKQARDGSTEPSDLPRIITGRAAAEAAAAGVDWSRIPHNAEMLSNIGQVALRAGSTEVGVHWLQAALLVDPNHVPTHKALMEYYEKKGDFYRAAEHRAQAGTP